MAIEFENRSKKILVNKAFQGGQASPTSWITVPYGTTAEIAALKRREGAVYWDTTLESLVVDNGSSMSPVGGGGGTPAGADGNIQFNDGGSFGGEAALNWDSNNTILEVSGNVEAVDIDASGALSGASVSAETGSISGSASGNPFNVFSSAQPMEIFVGNSTGSGNSLAITHHGEASPKYVDMHLWGVDNLVHLRADGDVHIPAPLTIGGNEVSIGKSTIVNTIAENTIPAISFTIPTSETGGVRFGFDIQHDTAILGDLVIHRVESDVSSEALRISRSSGDLTITGSILSPEAGSYSIGDGTNYWNQLYLNQIRGPDSEGLNHYSDDLMSFSSAQDNFQFYSDAGNPTITTQSMLDTGGQNSQPFVITSGEVNDVGNSGHLTLTTGNVEDGLSGDLNLTVGEISGSGTQGAVRIHPDTIFESTAHLAAYAPNTPITITPEAAAGTGADTSNSTDCGDIFGQITLDSGSASLASGTIVTVTLNRTFVNETPRIILTPANADAAQAVVWPQTAAANQFTLEAVDPLSPSTQYSWNYLIIGSASDA